MTTNKLWTSLITIGSVYWMQCGFNIATAQELQTVIEEKTGCIPDQQLQLTCPPDYIVILISAKYFKSQSPGCNPTETALCEISTVQADFFDLCFSLDSCTLPLEEPDPVNLCQGYNGDPFLKALYRCEPVMSETYEQNVQHMCNFGPSQWTGTLMYLWSNNFPRYSDETDCGCTITAQKDIEMHVKIPNFQVPAEDIDLLESEGCSQVIRVQSGTQRHSICSTSPDHSNKLEFSQRDATIYIDFQNPNRHSMRFWFVLQVHHDYKFNVTCGSNFEMPPLQSTVAHVPVISSTTEASHSSTTTNPTNYIKDPMEGKWPIITGVVASICVILVISVAVLLFCRSQHRRKLLRQKGINEMKNFTYQNSIYMTHSQIDCSSQHSGSQHSAQSHTSVNIEIVSNNNNMGHDSSISIISNTATGMPPTKPGNPVTITSSHVTHFGKPSDKSAANNYAPKTGNIDKMQGNRSKSTKASNANEPEYDFSNSDIPPAVLKRLNFQSETRPQQHGQTIIAAGAAVGETAGVQAMIAQFQNSDAKQDDKDGGEKKQANITPYSSMTDLSVKDLAKLMKHQLEDKN